MRKPDLEFAFEARVDLGPVIEVGRVPQGERRIIPIIGGTFEGSGPDGSGFRGRVLNHGADWQIVRPDGLTEIDTRYALETDSGAVVYIVNRGIRHGAPEVMARLRAGQPVDSSEYYFRTVPSFETAAPELAWMMRSIFIATAEREPGSVLIQFWRVI